jgi:K+/H+ antiporter YhaU regulatory subunit KhtT
MSVTFTAVNDEAAVTVLLSDDGQYRIVNVGETRPHELPTWHVYRHDPAQPNPTSVVRPGDKLIFTGYTLKQTIADFTAYARDVLAH